MWTTSTRRMSSVGICHFAVGGLLFLINREYTVSSRKRRKKLLPALALMVGLLNM